MKQQIDTTRRHLGELAAMSRQTEAMERQILERAEKHLAKIEGEIDKARADAMAGDDAAKDHYTEMVMERGRLQRVIEHAKKVLA